MRPTDTRRLVILAEGYFGDSHAKTAYGVIRFGRDRVVAVLDSSQAGRDVDEFLPGHPAPIVATLAEALALTPRPDALLIGIAPTGGKLPGVVARDDPRGDLGGAGRPVRAAHVHRRRPGVRGGGRGARHAHRGLPAATGSDGDLGRSTPRQGQAGDPDGRHGLRHRQDVGRAGAAPGGPGARRQRRLRAHRPDRDDDRRLGRRRGPAHRRLRPGHGRVDGRAGRVPRRLDPRRRPGLARPPRLLRGHAGAHPRRDAAGDDPGPQAGDHRARLRSSARRVVPDRVPARLHPDPRAGRRRWWRHRRSWRSP